MTFNHCLFVAACTADDKSIQSHQSLVPRGNQKLSRPPLAADRSARKKSDSQMAMAFPPSETFRYYPMSPVDQVVQKEACEEMHLHCRLVDLECMLFSEMGTALKMNASLNISILSCAIKVIKWGNQTVLALETYLKMDIYLATCNVFNLKLQAYRMNIFCMMTQSCNQI